jgi:hypothetical protein
VDALHRADVMAELAKGADLERTHVYERILSQAKDNGELIKRSLKYIMDDPSRFISWATLASPALLDDAIPQLLAFPNLELQTRTALLEIWKSRGDKAKAEAWKPN